MLSLLKNLPKLQYAVLCAVFYAVTFLLVSYLVEMPKRNYLDYFTFRSAVALMALSAICLVFSLPSAYLNDIQLKRTNVTSTTRICKLMWIGFVNGIVPITIIEISFSALVLITGPDGSWKTLLLNVNWLVIDGYFIGVNLLTLLLLRIYAGKQTIYGRR